MNRCERRRMKHNVHLVNISWGTLLERDPNYGASVVCYVCGAPHKARGLALIQDRLGTTWVPLCNPCLDDKDHRVCKKYLNAPDLEISEGGEATTEQLQALVERLGSLTQ